MTSVCFAANIEVYDFVKDYIRCLKRLKINNEKVEDLDSKQYPNEYEYTIEIMKNYRLAQTELQFAENHIDKYRNSKNELIAESSKLIFLVLEI